MKKLLILLALLFFCGVSEASYIFNPGSGGGGPTTLTDSNGCIWSIGSTIDTSGVVSVTLLSCPSVATPTACSGQPIGLLMALTCP